MAKFGLGGGGMKAIKTPKVNAKAGGGVPGDSSRGRINEAAGQKVTGAAGKIIATPQMLPPQAVTADADSSMVMPVDHPASRTARVIAKGGQL